MLRVNSLVGFGAIRPAAAGAAAVAFLGHYEDTGSSPYSTSFDFGTGVSNSTIVIAFTGHQTSSSVTASPTVGGNAMSLGVAAGGANEGSEIWYYDDAAGAIGGSETVAWTWASKVASGFHAWRLTGVATGGPGQTGTDTSGNPSSISISSVDVIVGACSVRHNSNPTFSWTGLTEDADAVVESGLYAHTSASAVAASATVTVGPSSSGVRDPITAVAGWVAA